ncbi:alpha/beta hydrolase family protein [Fontivita pretiosa]|uniref:alpha/beta hydrolase family protein n=1 Tax=Fontivita pretiosa TaxID=2989684 RepID=UPI003D16D591
MNPANHPDFWTEQRARLLLAMQQVMGPLPQQQHRPPPHVSIIEELITDRIIRRKIALHTERYDPGGWCVLRAWILIPRQSHLGPTAPAMLCLHQTTPAGKDQPVGLSTLPHDTPDLAYAQHLAERGYVTISPDYPGFGEAHRCVYAWGYASTTMKGIWNHMRVLDVLESLPQVDPLRIGVIGHSLGGHNALFLAAFDQRVRVIISSCGFTSFARYRGGEISAWSLDQYMPRVATHYHNDPAKMPFDFGDILAALAPRTVLINAPLRDDNFDPQGVDDCVEKARVAYRALHAEDRLLVEHPDAAHEFPPPTRQRFFDRLDASWRP